MGSYRRISTLTYQKVCHLWKWDKSLLSPFMDWSKPPMFNMKFLTTTFSTNLFLNVFLIQMCIKKNLMQFSSFLEYTYMISFSYPTISNIFPNINNHFLNVFPWWIIKNLIYSWFLNSKELQGWDINLVSRQVHLKFIN